jgi:ABC-type phosphate transport system ATPase subunit
MDIEKIKIENFGGIKEMEFEFKSISILIGPQGSGKSVTVKLLYFFKNFISEITKSIDAEENKRELDNKQKESFINFFPKESWPKGSFKITYTLNSSFIIIQKSKNNLLVFDYSIDFKNVINKGRKIFTEEKKKLETDPKLRSFTLRRKSIEKFGECVRHEISPIATYEQYFIPAGRSFFANIQNSIFSFLSDNRSLDPFLIEFGSFYENLKRFYKDIVADEKDPSFDKLVAEILNSKYLREKEKDFLIHDDSRKVNLSNASSGQQETLPLMIILKTLNFIHFSGGGATLYIEEPEAHLFPIAQKRIVQLLARTFNNPRFKFQIIVTTHSPYILSSFNNLLEAGKIVKEKPSELSEVKKIVPEKEIIDSDLLIAYSIAKGKNRRIMDEDSKLISQTILDSVSDEIAKEFGKLLDIEF